MHPQIVAARSYLKCSTQSRHFTTICLDSQYFRGNFRTSMVLCVAHKGGFFVIIGIAHFLALHVEVFCPPV